MKQIVTKGIVLSRTDYGEADRIVTLLTPNQGKLRMMARGVRKVKSKLAGGIELFSVSDITYMPGRGDIDTLISARLDIHYGNIVKDLDRVQLGYDLIKQLNKVTEDNLEPEYFELLQETFKSLNDAAISIELIRLWFEAQIIKLSGHEPNLQTDAAGNGLQPDTKYNFDVENMCFISHHSGRFSSAQIKALRLLFSKNPPSKLQKVQGINEHLANIAPLMRAVLQSYIRL